MVRSFDYAACAAVMNLADIDAGSVALVQRLAEAWRQATERAFLEAYRESIAGCPSWPEDEAAARRLLDFFLLDKALYEICYEAANRPNWIRIPLKGMTNVLGLEAVLDDQD